MKARSKNRSGQTMVEYIIIVALIAVALITLFGYFSKAVGTKVSAATSAIDDDAGRDAQGEVNRLNGERIKGLQADGTFSN